MAKLGFAMGSDERRKLLAENYIGFGQSWSMIAAAAKITGRAWWGRPQSSFPPR